jgi:DHA1 family multidrug resistance protein-like MFS transporter
MYMQEDASRRSGASQNWRATLFAVCVAQATAIVGFDFTLPFIPLYLQANLGVHGLGQTALWAGLIGFGPAIPATIFGPIWGRLADRVGYRMMLLRAMACAALLLGLMGLAPNPWILLGLRMIQGALTGTVYSAQALVATTVPEEEVGSSMGMLQMSVSLGATLGPLAGGVVAATLGYRAAFIGAGCLIAMATAVVFAYVQEPERRRESRHSDQSEERPSMWALLTIPAFAAALALTLVTQFGSTLVFPIIPLYVQDLLHGAGSASTATGWIFACAGIASALGSFAAGRLQRHLPLKGLLLAVVALAALFTLPQAFAGGYSQFLLIRSLAAVSLGALSGLVGTLAAISSPPKARGVAFGLMGAVSSLGFGAGPLLGGALAAMLGLRAVFAIAACLIGAIPLGFLAASVVAPMLRGRRRAAGQFAVRVR